MSTRRSRWCCCAFSRSRRRAARRVWRPSRALRRRARGRCRPLLLQWQRASTGVAREHRAASVGRRRARRGSARLRHLCAAPAERPPVLQPTPLGDRWAALVQQMAQRGLIAALVRELAMQSQWIDEMPSADAARWRLRVERESLRTAVLRDKLQAAVVAAHGSAVELELVDGVPNDTPALRDAAARERRTAQAEQTMTTRPGGARADVAVQDRAHRSRVDQAHCKGTPHHDEEPVGRPDEAGAGDAGQPAARRRRNWRRSRSRALPAPAW